MSYLSEQLHLLEENKTIYSGYLLLDTILDSKQQFAKSQQTDYTTLFELEPHLPISASCMEDLSLILSSCLDNALEATAKIQDPSKRWIHIRVYNDSIYLYLQIENSIATSVIFSTQQLPKTTKQNSFLHGMGLANVKRLVELHHGQLHLQCENFVFSVGLMLQYTSLEK